MSRHKWTDEEVEYLKVVCKGKYRSEIAKLMEEKFNMEFTKNTIKVKMESLNLKNGMGGFQKGRPAWNKGTKGKTKANDGSFSKGNISPLTKSIGAEKLRADGYIWIKISNDKWKLKQRHIYEKHHGKIPKGYSIVFADKNRSNFDIDNLLLVSLSEMAILNKNKLISEDAELTKTGLNIAKILDKVSKLKK